MWRWPLPPGAPGWWRVLPNTVRLAAFAPAVQMVVRQRLRAEIGQIGVAAQVVVAVEQAGVLQHGKRRGIGLSNLG